MSNGAAEKTIVQFARDADTEGAVARELAIHTSGKADDIEVGRRSYVCRAAKSIWMHICLTGREQEVAEHIQCACSEVRATAAMQEKYKSVNGKKRKVQTVMLPDMSLSKRRMM